MSARVFVVYLRQPRCRTDGRTDPFWEFGSFGCTGCHNANLLHPKNCQIADGDRLAFVQGGADGVRLLLVTGAVRRIDHPGGGRRAARGTVELRWDRSHLPFRYSDGINLFATDRPGASPRFPRLQHLVEDTNRPGWPAKLASRFRARAEPLEPDLAQEIVVQFEVEAARAPAGSFIQNYEDALPWMPSAVERDRRRRYETCLRNIGAAEAGA